MLTTDIKADGVIEVRIETQGKVWRGVIDPGDYTRAAEIGVTDLSAWTPEILAAWEAKKTPLPPLQELKARGIRDINAECERRIFAKYPLTKQLNVNDILVDPVYRQQMSDDKAAMIAVCNNATDILIPAATTEAEIEAIKSSIVWTI